MLYQKLLRRALAINLTSSPFRAYATMATPVQNFTLDKSIFNGDLYSRLRDFYFPNVPANASTPSEEVRARHFGIGLSEQEKAAVDDQCRDNFAGALESIGPEEFLLPPFESPAKDLKEAETLSAPLLAEIQQAQAQDAKKGTDTLLSLVVLLDQMPRNIYRDPAGLRKVYMHYDRLSFSLLHSSMRLNPSPIDHSSYRLRPVYKNLFLMPLMHSEHLPSHNLFYEIAGQTLKDVKEVGDEEAAKYVQMQIDFEHKHADIIKKFGRYPYRNELLGRRSTAEEEKWLETGETFGVKTGKNAGAKDEL